MPNAASALERPLDVLTATASDLRHLLESGRHSSVDLVHAYLVQIAKHNHAGMSLHAITATAPVEKLVEDAAALDHERKTFGPRSPLHGIPITIKDFFLSPSFGMETTCGSFALKGLNAKEDAAIATALKDAGCIIIGLANLSEWANCKGTNLTSGWSALGGQTQSPYVVGGMDPKDRWIGHTTPGGSSSGSAVGTAAGFSAFSIGSESDGSIVQPSLRAALYSIKGTVGDINMKGTMSGGAGFDSAGPIAKNVEDCADVMDLLLPGRGFRSHLTKSWDDIHIAYLDYQTWRFEDWICDPLPGFDNEHEAAVISALKAAEASGAKVTYDAHLLLPKQIMKQYNTVQMGDLLDYELAFCMERFLGLFANSTLRSIGDLVQFNKNHADLELPPHQPNQVQFEKAAASKMTQEEYESGLKHLRQSFRDAIEKCFESTNANVIMASGESFLSTISGGSGYPIASVPLGLSSFNGRPHGMLILARNGEEAKVFEVMSAWEATFPDARQPPPQLVKWSPSSEL
ncbi:amidase signature domain-containing protein [Nemania abortiva]|nr:amidase signature domain-containing protein [Nemania abortiva]